MKYILDDEGYIKECSETDIVCENKTCKEYKGKVPDGFKTYLEWALNSNIRAYKIKDGNLIYDEKRDATLKRQYKLEEKHNYRMQAGEEVIVSNGSLSYLDVYFDIPFKYIPFVVLTPNREVTYYYVSNKSEKGFRINFYLPSKDSVCFNWIALDI